MIATVFTGRVLLYLGEIGWITQLTSAEAYLYGSLISAVDPVSTLSVFKKSDAPPLLFNLVFGESVLNDGVAIVAFTIFQEFVEKKQEVQVHTMMLVVVRVIGIAIGSVLLAAMVCCVSAFLLKRADSALQDYPSYEISIILLSAYLSYVVADLAGLSGIVALFFSGVLMSHYHLYNISTQSATALTHLLSTLAFLAENFIFLYLGLSVVAYSGYFNWEWRFILINLVLCLIARALNIFPLCLLANCGRAKPIPFNYMIVIWFSGLRGAIAFALALNVQTDNPTHAALMKSSTLFTVMFTTIVLGMGTSPLLLYLDLGKTSNVVGIEMRQLLVEDSSYKTTEESVGRIHRLWEKVDEDYLKPVLGGNPRACS